MSDHHLRARTNGTEATGTTSACDKRPIIVGIYGVPGSGKTFLLNQLKHQFEQENFLFFEGAEMIAASIPGGLDAFQKLDPQEKKKCRGRAIDSIRKECADRQQTGVVTGHYMFWPEEGESLVVCTQNDMDTYTHILYLDIPAEVVFQRQLNDTERVRPSMSVFHLLKWKMEERDRLRQLSRDKGILFTTVSEHPALLDKVSTLLRDFRQHDEKHNCQRAERALDEALADGKGKRETVLLMDGDRTLAPEDTGTLFWDRAKNCSQFRSDEVSPLKALFGSQLGYSYAAFRQAMLLYEERADPQEYDRLCQKVASTVKMHPEFLSLLRTVAQEEHIGAVLVSCGLRLVWEKVLEREGLAQTVKVIAGGRISDGFVVTAAVKAALVCRLRDVHHVYVWAIGDSVLDLEMLKVADRAVVVVGEEHVRSKTMDEALLDAIDQDNLKAVQILLPSHSSPRLDTARLPIAQLADSDFIDSIFSRRKRPGLPVFDSGDKAAAKLLATPMRDSKVEGPALREAHRRAGYYLAIEVVAGKIGLEECQISHVLGHAVTGSRLLQERRTTIVALMRAGEPMASGVNDAFPLSMFVHARRPADIQPHHLQEQRQVLLVDAVVNTGKTVIEFVRAIREHDAEIRIFIVAGVVQAQCVAPDSHMNKSLAGYNHIELVALRLSATKFTGSGATDTGNRLFNTTGFP